MNMSKHARRAVLWDLVYLAVTVNLLVTVGGKPAATTGQMLVVVFWVGLGVLYPLYQWRRFARERKRPTAQWAPGDLALLDGKLVKLHTHPMDSATWRNVVKSSWIIRHDDGKQTIVDESRFEKPSVVDRLADLA